MVHDAPQLVEQAGRGLPALDLGVVDGLGERAQAQVLVARVEQEAARGRVHGAHLLALAATGAGLHVLQEFDEGFLVLQRGLLQIADEPVEGEGVRLHGQRAPGQLAGVEDILGVHDALVRGQGVDLLLAQEGDLGDADAVLAADLAPQAQHLGKKLLHGLVGLGQHLRVVGVHRHVDVAVAVARVHVVGDDDAPGLGVLVQGLDVALQARVLVAQLVEQQAHLAGQLLVGKLACGGALLQDEQAALDAELDVRVVDRDSD